MSTSTDDPIHKAAFLGPKGENAEEFERLLLEVLRDHVFWRRNFHPSDPRLIDERDKRMEAYDEMAARLRDELSKILAALKRAAPLYSPRQVAHIVSDPSLPALVGYFAGMLYNQNNVVAEVSPETVREEREYFKALARMVGYPSFLPETVPPNARTRRAVYSWGHLCSGGTVANLEALWVARNVRLYPLAIRLVAEETEEFASFADLEVTTAQGDRGPLRSLSTFRLSNLPIDEITDLHLRIKASLGEGNPDRAEAFQDALPTVRNAGLASFLLRYNETFPNDRARLPKVFISQATHYCWQKNMDLVGLGANALETVPVDHRIRLDTDALHEQLQQCMDDQRPVLGVVSIVGTTEEGAIDPLQEIEDVRADVEREGLTFWHHCDAAFGGYWASLLPKTEDGAFVPVDAVDDDLAGPNGLLPTDDVEALRHLADTDSLVVDPHKFGYIPYPAGAVLFRDHHLRDAIAYKAPYLADEEASGFGGFLGQWTLEGSRPGATAVSCYLSQELVPLTPEGHGRFMRNCIEANQQLVTAFRNRFGKESELSLLPFHPPETVAFCFVVAPEAGVESIDALNELSTRIWQRMTVDGREDIGQYSFLLSRTEVDVGTYQHVLEDVLPSDLVNDAAQDGAALVLLRTCLMNPLQADWNAETGLPFAERLADVLYEIAGDEYLQQVLPPVPTDTKARHPVLVVEQSPQAQGTLTRLLEHDEKVVAHFDVRSSSVADVKDALANGSFDPAGDVVIHMDLEAPGPLPQLIETLVTNGRIDSDRIRILLTHTSDSADLHCILDDLELSPEHVIAENSLATGARRFIMQLCSRDNFASSER